MKKASMKRSKKAIEKENIWDYFVDYVTDLYFSLMPSDDILELPTSYMWTVGILVYIGAFCLFTYFVYEGVVGNIGQKFLSLSPSAGICNSITKPLSGSFKADALGRWEGSEGFEYSLAKYQFTANSLAVTDEEWVSVIFTIKDDIIYPMSLQMRQSDLAFNILVWTAWSVSVVKSGHIQSFSLTGAPDVVFYRENYVGSVGSIHGDCPLTAITTFDSTSYFFNVQYDINQYTNNSVCMQALQPDTVGNSKKSAFMDIGIDTRSLIIAAGVNEGLVSIDSLVNLNDYATAPFELGDMTVVLSVLYHPRFPGMNPIACLINQVNNTALGCFMLIGYSIQAIPLLNHHGSGTDLEPRLCDCLDGTGYMEQCSEFNFLAGILLFQGDSLFDIAKLLTFAAVYNFNFPLIKKLAFKAMYAMVSQDVTGNTFQNNTYRHSAYDFCYGNCSIVTVNAYDAFYQTSLYYYSVLNGSCTDTISSDSFENLVIPVARLTEVYYECISNLFNSIINSMGIASGNFQLFLPPFIGICILIAKFVMKYFGITERPYGQGERDDILDSLALQLLLYRDKKMPNSDSLDSYSTVLSSIVTECKINVNESDGYLDKVATLNGHHNLRASLGLPLVRRSYIPACNDKAETKINDANNNASSKPNVKIYPIQVAVKPKEPSTTAALSTTIEMTNVNIPNSILKEAIPIEYQCSGNCKDIFAVYLISSGKMFSLVFPSISFTLTNNNQPILLQATSSNFPSNYLPLMQISQIVAMSINDKMYFVNLTLKNSNELNIVCPSLEVNGNQIRCVLVGCQLVYAMIP